MITCRSKRPRRWKTLLRYLIEETGYADYLERTAVEQQDDSPMANVDELITAAVEFDRQHPEDGSLEAFLEQVALVSDTDAFEDSSDRVTLMTLHAAKGLEFPHVFIIGVEDGMLPHKRSKDTEAEFEEERRLLFVGITRAQQRLQLSCCKRRAIRGDVRPVIPSPFLNELPLEEMLRIESTRERDWFDDDQSDYDQSYPDSWDLPEEESGEVKEGAASFDTATDELCQLPEEDVAQPTSDEKKVGITTGLKTGADLLASRTTPLTAYQEGIQVRHSDYGEGTIISVTGRGPKRVAKVQFADEEHSFRLAFADLEVIDD